MLLHKKLLAPLSSILAFAVLLNFGACKLEDLEDPNNPGASNIQENATIAEVQNVVDGIQSGMRNNLPIYYDGVGVVGREFWRFSGSDPRYTRDLLGSEDAVLDPGGFYTTNAYGSRYRVVRNCYILENAVANSSDPAIDAGAIKAANGFSKTIRAHEMLLALVQQWDNGIRVDVADPDRLGPFLNKDAALDALAALLDEAYDDLTNAGPKFPFKLRSGFAGFDTPGTFAEFNRALAARVDAYRADWNGVIDALNHSFLDQGGDLNTGVYYVYSISGGDLLNEMYQTPTATGEIRIVHPSFKTDADAGDDRLAKAFLRADAPTQSGLSGNLGFNVYASNTSSIPVIRNEELILLLAEANINLGGGGLTIGKGLLDAIRASHGLGGTSATTQDELIDEMLKQRRYSLFGEGHRWADMRRYGRLNQLPIDRPGDDVWDRFPRPAND